MNGEYYVTLFSPWDAVTHVPIFARTYQGLLDMMRRFRTGGIRGTASFLDRSRLRIMNNIMQGLRVHQGRKKTFALRRSSRRTLWRRDRNHPEHKTHFAYSFPRGGAAATEFGDASGGGMTGDDPNSEVNLARKEMNAIQAQFGENGDAKRPRLDKKGIAHIDDTLDAVKGILPVLPDHAFTADASGAGSATTTFPSKAVFSSRIVAPIASFSTREDVRKAVKSVREHVADSDPVAEKPVPSPFARDRSGPFAENRPENPAAPTYNAGQKVIIDSVRKYLTSLSGNAGVLPQGEPPLRIFVHGGAGTGKSYVIRGVTEEAKAAGFEVMSMAFLGVAASNIDGFTINSCLSIPIANDGDDKSGGKRLEEIKGLTLTNLQAKFRN